LLAEFMAVGIDAGAHGGDEFLELPSLYKIEIGPERTQLTGYAAGPGEPAALPVVCSNTQLLPE
jgi:hypothetical protein